MIQITKNIILVCLLLSLGFSGCAYALVAPMFISEIAEPSIRGALASLMQLMATLGLLFVDALNINGAVHWNYISAICIGIPGNTGNSSYVGYHRCKA